MEENTSNNSDVETNNAGYKEETANQYFQEVCEFFSPLQSNWSFIQEILLWQKPEISVVIFNIINVLFWSFITPRLQVLVALAILVSSFWLIPPFRLWVLSIVQKTRKLSEKDREGISRENINEDSCDSLSECQPQTSSTQNRMTYEDFCNGVAVVWRFYSKYLLKMKHMKTESPQKFYGLLFLLLVFVAIFYRRFPVGNMAYLAVMFLFLWPAIVFYGIKDKITGKLYQLFLPFVTQWQNSRTKRKRNVGLKDGCNDSDLSEEEDFVLNSNKETEAIFGSVLPVQRLTQTSYLGAYDSIDSSLVSTEGLEFPSLRRESVESYNSDDFIDGLNFGSFNADAAGSCHSSMDSLVVNTDERHNPSYAETTADDEQSLREPVSDVIQEQEVRMRTREHSPTPPPPSRNKSLDDLQSYEVVETSEIEQEESNRNNDELQHPAERSYLASGAGYVGKFFGYSS